MNLVRVAVTPVSMRPASLKQRKARVLRAIGAAADAGARLVCFPEYVDVQRTREAMALPDRPHRRLAEAFPGGPFTAAVREACARRRIGALYGICAWQGRKLLNLTVSVGRDGEILGAYAKTHLAPDEGPEGGIAAGGKIAPLRTVAGLAGVITCYEVNFPEIARTHRALGARFFVVPTAGNSELFVTLARARAAENCMPLIFSSYSFAPGMPARGAGAAVVDAFGRVLAQTARGTRVLAAEIDLDGPVRSPHWHGRGRKVDLREFLWKRRRKELYARA
ncbi:MAG: carbon-nitrogen hydrolase family protein [Planctomycetota bacterium]|nr:carbon-nitrogen hydrolase family protein [Planctomycetota bacterium]